MTSFVAMHFDFDFKSISNPFSISILVDDCLIVRRVYSSVWYLFMVDNSCGFYRAIYYGF